MKGTQTFTTNLGGLLGIFFYVFIAVFLQFRVQKLTTRDNPDIYEVSQGLNLMEDKEIIKFDEQSFTIGFGLYTQVFTQSSASAALEIEMSSVDISDLLVPVAYMKYYTPLGLETK